jgi:predicted lipoprotein with Yx(FWY)xxD motif
VAVALLAVALSPLANGAGKAASKRVAKYQPSTGGKVLANLGGKTLYSLSVERHGKFICKAGCLSIWHPLMVPENVRPTGPVGLGKVKRPEGSFQVTYAGKPLYSFSGDTRKGQTNGDGIKDVGTWHPAKVVASTTPESVPIEQTPQNPYPTGYPQPAPTESPPSSPPSEPPYYPPYGGY